MLELARDGADIAAAVSIHGDLKTAAAAKKGAVKAKLLVAHGAPDPVAPKADRDAFESEMDAAGAKWQMLIFSGVYHAYTDQGSDVPGVAGWDEPATPDDLRGDTPVHRRRLRGQIVTLFLRRAIGQERIGDPVPFFGEAR